MFDIGWGEFVVIGVVALVVIGPKELPGVLRAVGQWTTKIRRMAAEFQSQFQEALREAEMADLKKDVENLNAEVRSATAGVTSKFDEFEAPHSSQWQPKSEPLKAELSEADDPKPETGAPASADGEAALAETAMPGAATDDPAGRAAMGSEHVTPDGYSEPVTASAEPVGSAADDLAGYVADEKASPREASAARAHRAPQADVLASAAPADGGGRS
jgi:sec-independent protein translocase protein TatB